MGGVVKKLVGLNIITKLIEEETVTGLLYSRESTRDRRGKKALVVQGNEDVPEGETILVPYNAGTLDNINGQEYLIVDQREVIYIL